MHHVASQGKHEGALGPNNPLQGVELLLMTGGDFLHDCCTG